MSQSTSTGCKNCGARCIGPFCQNCQVEHDYGSRNSGYTEYECPNEGCDGITSGPNAECRHCRREEGEC